MGDVLSRSRTTVLKNYSIIGLVSRRSDHVRPHFPNEEHMEDQELRHKPFPHGSWGDEGNSARTGGRDGDGTQENLPLRNAGQLTFV